MKIYTLRLNDRTIELLNKIQEVTGSESHADVIRHAVLTTYRTYYKDYMPASVLNNDKKAKKTPEMKDEERRYNICAELNGTVIDKNGAKSCSYKTYEVVNPSLVEEYEQQIPFSMLETRLIKEQYNPSKEECEKIINLK